MVKEIKNEDEGNKEIRYKTVDDKLVEREATQDEIAEQKKKKLEAKQWIGINAQKLVEEIKKIEIIPYINADFNEDEKLIQLILNEYIGLAKNEEGELTDRADEKGIISPENFDKSKELIDKLQVIIDDRREKYKKLYSASSTVDDYLNDFEKKATSEGISGINEGTSGFTLTKDYVKNQYLDIGEIKKKISFSMALLNTTTGTARLEHSRISARLLSSQTKLEA